jgi:AraC-like DNA-binding protein
MFTSTRRRQDLASWQEQLSSSFVRLDVAAVGAVASLDTRLATTTKGKVHAAVVDVVGEPHVVRRTRRGAAHDDGGLLVSVQMQGSCIVRQAGREAHLSEGDIAWYHAAEPYDLVFPEGTHQQVVLQINPDEFFRARTLLDHTATRVLGDQGIGHAVAPLLRAIPQSLQDAEVGQADRVAQIAVDLLLLSVPSVPTTPRTPDLLESTRQFIQAHADDPDLTPGSVAAAVHLSVGHLHRIFRGSDSTVGEFLRRARLEHAATDLRDPRFAHWTVADIAQRRGFRDAGHFSRAFASHYGVSPTSWRRTADR